MYECVGSCHFGGKSVRKTFDLRVNVHKESVWQPEAHLLDGVAGCLCEVDGHGSSCLNGVAAYFVQCCALVG